MHFCPLCGNMLLMEEGGHGMRFCCPTCPYLHNLRRVYSSKVPIKKKQVDDVLGGDNAWENVDRTNARCPQCSHDTAFFMQIQIRSADEPSTTFYRCVRCAKQWNDNSQTMCTLLDVIFEPITLPKETMQMVLRYHRLHFDPSSITATTERKR